MRALVLYHPKSDHGGRVEDFARDYEKYKGSKLELLSLEELEGAEIAKLYDITSYPAMIVIEDNGQLYKMWQGGNLPLMNELQNYSKL